jgi:hypothetical protein
MSIQAMKRLRAAMALYAAVLASAGLALWLRHVIPWPMGAAVTGMMLTLAVCLRPRRAPRSGVTLRFPEAWACGEAAPDHDRAARPARPMRPVRLSPGR